MEWAEIEKRFESAKRIALEAAAFLFSHLSLRMENKTKAPSDYVTEADVKVEEIIISKIRELYSDDSIYGEEHGKEGKSKRRWIIDPIDGTNNFMFLFPCYSISIGFEDEDGLEFGVIYIPSQKEEYYALKGHGAFLNGRRICVHESDELSKDLMIATPPERRHEYMNFFMPRLRSFFDVFSDIRSIGSAASSLAFVACGRVDAYYEISLKIYDAAAGIVIAREAGAVVDLINDDESFIEILASSKSAYPRLREIVGGKASII